MLDTKVDEDIVYSSFKKVAEGLCKANSSEKVLTASKQLGSGIEHYAFI